MLHQLDAHTNRFVFERFDLHGSESLGSEGPIPHHDGDDPVLVVLPIDKLLCFRIYKGFVDLAVGDQYSSPGHDPFEGAGREEVVEGEALAVRYLERLEKERAEHIVDGHLSNDQVVEIAIQLFLLDKHDDILAFRVLVAGSGDGGLHMRFGGEQEIHGAGPRIFEDVEIPTLDPVIHSRAQIVDVLPRHHELILDVFLERVGDASLVAALA